MLPVKKVNDEATFTVLCQCPVCKSSFEAEAHRRINGSITLERPNRNVIYKNKRPYHNCKLMAFKYKTGYLRFFSEKSFISTTMLFFSLKFLFTY